MAHARRKIHDVHVRHPTAVTTEVLNHIGALYAIESEIRGSPARLYAKCVAVSLRLSWGHHHQDK